MHFSVPRTSHNNTPLLMADTHPHRISTHENQMNHVMYSNIPFFFVSSNAASSFSFLYTVLSLMEVMCIRYVFCLCTCSCDGSPCHSASSCGELSCDVCVSSLSGPLTHPHYATTQPHPSQPLIWVQYQCHDCVWWGLTNP